MPERGITGGLDFRFENFPAAQQQQMGSYTPPQPVEAQVPEFSDDPLAVREKLTSDYYSNMGMLRSFATDMAKKGIDVFEPDYSQEGGGLAFQTAKKLEASVMYAANALSNEFKAEQQTRPYELTGQTVMNPNVDRQGLAYSDAQNFTSTKPLPGTDELNQRLAQETNDPSSQNRANAQIAPYLQRLDQMVQQGLISPEKAEIEKQAIIENTWKTQMYAPRTSGISQEDLSRRAQLIKQVKSGILTNDQTALNLFKVAPGVEDVEYVNTGDKVGIQVYMKGQGQPAFIDLQKGGEGEINAFLNRIEGQKNVPNEMVFSFDTKVSIPASNARQVIDDVKTKAAAFTPETVQKLQDLATEGQLMTPNGEPIASIQLEGPWMGFVGGNDIVITYFPVVNNRVNYSKPRTKKISDPAEIESYIEANSNKIAPAFGGGFVDPNAAPNEAQRAQELIKKYRR